MAFANLFEKAGFSRKGIFYQCDYDLNELGNAIQVDSYLKVAVQKYRQLFFKAGYDFKSTNDSAVEYLKLRFRVMDNMAEMSTDILWREIAGDLETYSNAFVIKSREDILPGVKATGLVASGKPISCYYRAHPARMQIEFDDKGKIKGYKQITISGKEKIFPKSEVIHFTLDREAGSVWGTPRWIAVLDDIKMLREVEGNILALIYRYAMPLVHMIIGLPETGKEGTQKEIDDARRMVEKTPMDGMYITDERHKVEVVGTQGAAIDMAPYHALIEKRVFSGMNVSESMMGRGGSKQDADSMEEQVHNIIKDDQANFALQFKEYVINELLMEGGFNPVLNEDDIVMLDFREINLDTKVKIENHEINKFEKNAITFEELRQHLGEKVENVDTGRMYSQMFTQANTLEQINAQNDAAIKLAQVSGEIQKSIAKAQPAATSSSYTKKATGNGKTKTSTSKTKTVSNNDSPKNQHGTHSAKIKESLDDNFLNETISSFKDLTLLASKKGKISPVSITKCKESIHRSLKQRIKQSGGLGSKAAFADLENSSKTQNTSMTFTNNALNIYIKDTLDNFFVDIKNKASNNIDGKRLAEEMSNMEYRLRFLVEFVDNKSFWYSYMKTLEYKNIKEAKVCGPDDSKHKHAFKTLNTSNFGINDIPGFSPGCHCYIVPVIKK